ncbi:MAG: IS21 family transposase [Spirochaetales bacterium]
MVLPSEVEDILLLSSAGWPVKAIVRQLGFSRNTVKRYIAAGGFVEYKNPQRPGLLDGLGGWLEEQFKLHRGNAEVVRQELIAKKKIHVSLRTVERAVGTWRKDLAVRGLATTRYETKPGEQAQIDFGERQVNIGGEMVKVHLFVFVLGFSRRIYVQVFADQRLESWLKGTENAFRRFSGVPAAVLTDNAKALVISHDIHTREVVYNPVFVAFSRHWGFDRRSCAPYRARTKGKVESAVGYVKNNALAGREFDSWQALEIHLDWWMDQIADQRVLQELGGTPLERFELEVEALKSLACRPDFLRERELSRKVHSDLCVEVDTNHYSVPWKHIGESVSIGVRSGQIVITHAGKVRSHIETTRLLRFVPFRLIRPFFVAEVAGLPDAKVNRRIVELASAEFQARKPLYQFTNDGGALILHHDWIAYLVAHDRVWNLIPEDKAVNSAKSDSLPSDKYLRPFVETHFDALVLTRESFPGWTSVWAMYQEDLGFSTSLLTDRPKFLSAFEDALARQLVIATRQGFRSGWTYQQATK